MIKPKKVANKQQIISEYLSSKHTFAQLEQRYGVPARTIQSWVRSFRKTHPVSTEPKVASTPQLDSLQQQLEHLTLKNQLLEQMLQLAEEHTGIDITKKFGTRQS